MICKNCGHRNEGEANFCSSCGTEIEHFDDANVTAAVAAISVPELPSDLDLPGQVEELAPGDAMLLVKKGSNVGSTYLLDEDVIKAGRHPDSQVSLDDVTVSRRHAEFRRSGKRYEVVDVGSLNGTYVNGERVESAALERGDEVQIGKFKLVFLTGSEHAQ